MSFTQANRLIPVKPSPTLSIAAKAKAMAKEGRDIVNLGTGEPDFDTPLHIKEAAIQAIREGFTKYTAVEGIPELKDAIIQKFKRDNALQYSANQVLVSVGGKHSCYNLCQALLNEGDEVIIPAPYWVSYPDMVLLALGKPVFVSTTANDHYKMSPEALEKAITPKTKLLFLNSPSNPSGIAYTKEELKALGEVLLRYPHVFIATDDMYEHMLFSGEFCNILNATPSLYSRTIVLNGVSKAYAMTGWRIGYAAGDPDLIKAMGTIQSQSTSNPCSIAQKAAVEALNGPQDSVVMMRDVFKQRHQYLVDNLSCIEGIHMVKASGTFYLFPDLTDVIKRKGYANDLAFSDALLQEKGLAIVPGSAFGQEGAIRLSFAASQIELDKATQRLIEFCR
jgi:aspartate aminotransferase